MSPRTTASTVQSPLRSQDGPSARKRFSKIATTAVAAAGISAVAVSCLGSHSAVAATNPPQANGLRLDSITVPAQGAASMTAFTPHVFGAIKHAPGAANQVSSTPGKHGPGPGSAAPAHAPAPAPAKPAVVKVAVVKRAPVHHAPAAPVKPYRIYDSVTPSAIPAHQDAAVYSNGAYAATESEVAGHGHTLWIDTNGSNPHANALDVEPGDATPAGAAAWVKTKLSSDSHHVAIVYTMISQWQAVKDNVAGLPHWMQDKVRYWIADPTGVEHVLPGANATQWYWGNSYDITTANPGFQS